MKKFFFLSLALILSLPAFAREVTVGVFVHAPHVYKNETDDGAYGPAIDYVSQVMAEMGYEPVYRLLPLSRVLLYLKDGQIDLSLEIAKTPEREEYAYFSDEPVYVMVPSLTVLATNKIDRIDGVDDLSGMKIGFLGGAAIPSFFDSAKSVVFESVSGDSWIRQNLARLLAGRIDAAMDMNAYSYREEAKRQGVESKIKTLRIPGEETRFYVAFSKASAKAVTLLERYNAVVKADGYDEQKMIDDFIAR